jgi:hypothetical protein
MHDRRTGSLERNEQHVGVAHLNIRVPGPPAA